MCYFTFHRQVVLASHHWSYRPPPCAHFSFTAIDDRQAVLFGGRQPHARVNDCYLMDFELMVCPEIVVM